MLDVVDSKARTRAKENAKTQSTQRNAKKGISNSKTNAANAASAEDAASQLRQSPVFGGILG